MIVGISGLAGSGKDTVADMLVHDRGFIKIGLADPMKQFCKQMFDFTDEQLYGPSAFRNAVDERYPRGPKGVYRGYLTPRHALQTLGTEWGRACYEDIWIDYALRQAWDVQEWGYGVVIPDIRFQNELAAIKKVGGEVWRVVRPGAGLSGDAAAHASENDIQDADCDRVIVNDGTLADLVRSVKAAKL